MDDWDHDNLRRGLSNNSGEYIRENANLRISKVGKLQGGTKIKSRRKCVTILWTLMHWFNHTRDTE